MGKGNRNRVGREDDNVLTKKSVKAKKRRARRPLPKLLIPIVSLVVVVAIVVAAVALALYNNGTFKRYNVLVKSQTSGKYSVNQQMAQVLVWTSVWDQAAQLYQYYSGLADSEFEYCWGQAMNAKYSMHEYIGDYYATTFASLVAACDEGVRQGIEFTKEEQDEAYNTLLTSLKSEAYSYYSYLYNQGLSNITASYVYYSGNPYFGQFLRETVGKDIKEKDIRRAAVVQAYADKVYSQKQSGYWDAADDAAIKAEVDENRGDYYSTEYLSYSTSSAALAAILKDTTTADAFKTEVVKAEVEEHYLSLYNNYVTGITGQANESLAAVRSKTTAEELDAALTEQGMEKKTYTAETAETELTGDLHAIEHWLFPSGDSEARAQFDAATVTSEDGKHVFVVVVSAVEGENVTAAIKRFDYTELSAEDIAKLTNTVLKSLELPVAEGAAVYESAAEKAKAIADALKAEGADKAQILSDNGATTVTGVAEETGTVPEAIREAVFAAGVQSGDVLTVGTQTTVHVVSVTAVTAAAEETAASADISYVTVEEKMDDVVSSLTETIGSEVPATRTASYTQPLATRVAKALDALNAAEDKADYMTDEGATSAAGVTAEDHKSLPDEVAAAVLADGVAAGATLTAEKADGFTKYVIYVNEATDEGKNVSYLTFTTSAYLVWLFDGVDPETMTGGPAAGTTLKVDPTGDDTAYSVYMALSDVKLDTETVVRGGYLSYSTKEEAEAGLERLKGLSGYELLTALSDLGSSATVSNAVRESSVEGALQTWLFSDSRAANDAAVVEVIEEDDEIVTYYLAVYLGKMAAWESSARTNYANDCASDWLESVVENGGYSVSESALKKVKNPKPPKSAESETEEDTAAAAE